MKNIVLLFLLALFSACSTIYFKHNASSEEMSSHEERWHHNVILGLWEISTPVDLSQACEYGWDTVKTEKTLINVLAETAAGMLTFGGSLWNPMTVEYQCKEKPKTTSNPSKK